MMGTKLDVQTLASDVLEPGRFVYEDLNGKWVNGADYGKYAVLYFGEKASGSFADPAARTALEAFLASGGTVIAGGREAADGLFGKDAALRARVTVVDRPLGRVKEDYSAAGRKLGYADDIGDWVFTDEGRDVKALTERYAKAFQGAKGVARASQREKWELKPLGAPGDNRPPKSFAKKVAWGKRPQWADGIALVDGDRLATVVVTDRPRFGRLAEELVWHVKEMSGRELPIADKEPADGSAAIVFKAFDGRNDRAVIRREGNVVYVGGVEAGPSHALTYLLESLGIRYLWSGPTGKVIPKKAKVVLPDIALDWEHPFRVRRMRLYFKGCAPDRGGFRDFCQWHGMNDVEGFNADKPLPVDRWEWGHQYADYYPRFRKSHPEWFALQPDGTRVLHLGIHTERPTFCLSNPALAEQVAREKIAEYRANPTKKALSLCLPDGATSSWCLCEECRRLDPVNSAPGGITVFWPKRRSEKYVALTDRVYTFMNRVAELVAKECPDVLLSVYAYGCYTAAPVKVKPHPNLLILSVAGSYSSLEGFASAQENLAAWMSFGNNLLWRPNMNRGTGSPAPQNYGRHVFEDLTAMAVNGVYGTDFDTMYNEWAVKSIGYYFTARAHLNPDLLDYETWLEDYCRSGFGAAAGKVREYYGLLEKALDDAAALNSANKGPAVTWEQRQRRANRIYETLDLDRLDSLVAEAKALAGDDAEVQARLDRLAFGNRVGRWTKRRLTDKGKETFAAFAADVSDYLAKDPAAIDANRLLGKGWNRPSARTDNGIVFKGVEVHDAASLVETNGMWMPCRVDAKTLAALPDKTKTRALTTTGVELRFCVRSGEVKLVMGGLDERARVDCRVYRGDVICDWPGTTRTVEGTNSVWTFRKSPAAHLRRRAEKFGCRYDPDVVRIVLPPTGRIGLRDVIGEAVPPSPEMLPRTTYLAYGSSITHGSDSLVIERSYAALVGEALGADVRNLGLAGCARMENEVADFIANERGLDYISLEMGVNVVGTMPVDEYERRVRYMVRRVATAHPKARVLAIDVYRCEGAPDRQRKAQAFRETLARVVRELDLPNVVYVNGLDALPEKGSLSTGALHPSPKGHEAIAAHLVARFRDAKAGWRIPSPEDPLVRFHRENDGKAIRRLPTWIVPENAFIGLNNDDFDIPDSKVADRVCKALEEDSDYNCATYTLRCVPDLSDPRVEARVAKTAKAMKAAGIELLMDVDPRIFRNEFLKRWPGDNLRIRQLELVEPKDGVAEFAVREEFMRDHMCYGTEPYSWYRPVRLVGAWAAKDGDVAALREVTAENVVSETNFVSGTVRSLAPGEKLLVEAEFELKEVDPYSPHIMEFTREMSLRYRALGVDGTMRDEWGFCTPRRAMAEHRAFWHSAPFAAAYARLSGGRDLVKDLPLMAFGPASAEKRAAIAAYMRAIYDRCKETEEDFYASNKEYFGTDIHVTKHATWGTNAKVGEFSHNGFSWWAARRDWAQGDESARVPALNGMAKKFGGPLWLNEGYGGPSELHYPKTLWRYVLAGGRMVYHGIADRRRGDMDPEEFRFRRSHDLMKPEVLRAEEISRLLPLVTRAQIDCPTAQIFGHARLVNWADSAYEDWGEGLFNGLGFRGHYVDAYPASELEGETFAVGEDGYLRVGQQRYAACILYRLSDAERAGWERLVNWKGLKTAVFVDPSADEVAAYLESVGATRQTPFGPTGYRNRKDGNKLPPADGTMTLIDGTVVRVKGANPEVTGDPIEGELDVGGTKVTYAATGLFAARTDKDGNLTALAAGRLRRVSLPGFTLALDNPEDVALVKIGPAWFGTWQTGDTSAEVPAALRAITPNWVRLTAAGLRR